MVVVMFLDIRLELFPQEVFPPGADITGKVIVDKNRIARIGEIHFKAEG